MTAEERSAVKDEFPVGMRVLAVDDDPTCLKVLENLLVRCQYNGLSKTSILFPFLPAQTDGC